MADRTGYGTRFRVFPQAPFLAPSRPPEMIVLPIPAGAVGPGPSDDRLYVIQPVGKQAPYGLKRSPYGTPFLSLPPWRGRFFSPAMPDRQGHFDYLEPGSPQFAQAHVFAVARFTLCVWENYFGHKIPWHFQRHFPRLEVTILPILPNAVMGYGFMEVGTVGNDDGTRADFALNFDVIAHEMGHLLLYSLIGVPSGPAVQEEYFGFQESAADCVALLAALHFDSVIDDLLDGSSGNLYSFNELNRFAELTPTDQVRFASNERKLSEFALGWDDEHDLSQPLTGAIFDIFVDIFQDLLVERGLIPAQIANLSRDILTLPSAAEAAQAAFDESYPQAPQLFRRALVAARDLLGVMLAATWRGLGANFLSFDDVARRLLTVEAAMTGGRFQRAISESFLWRDIGRIKAGPRLSPLGHSHSASVRSLVPEAARQLPPLSFRERVALSRGPSF